MRMCIFTDFTCRFDILKIKSSEQEERVFFMRRRAKIVWHLTPPPIVCCTDIRTNIVVNSIKYYRKYKNRDLLNRRVFAGMPVFAGITEHVNRELF